MSALQYFEAQMFLWLFLDCREKLALLRHLKFSFLLQVFNMQKYILKKVSPPVEISALRFLQTLLLEKKNSVSPEGIDISNLETRQPYVRTQAPPKNIIIEFHLPLLKDYEADVSSVSPSSSLSD